MTDQHEPVDDATQYRRKIDDSLARFSAAHDEYAEEEAARAQRRTKLTAAPGRLIEQTRTRLQRVVAPASTDEEAGESEQEPQSSRADAGKAQRTRLQEKKFRRTHRSVMTWRVAAAVVAGLVFLATGSAWGAKTWFNSKFEEIAALDKDSDAIRNIAGQIGDENFLIVGSDTRAGAAAEEGVGTAEGVPGARSDTIMLAHIPQDRARAVVVSFPRDLEIFRPDCERFDPRSGAYTGETVEGGHQVKLNTAYAVGGPKCVTKVIQQITGMRMTHFVGIDFSGFKGMVDAVGGVTVQVDEAIEDTVLGTVVPEPGAVHLVGDQALKYVRARHVVGDPTSGYGRIHRQQKFISALLDKTMSRDVLLDPGKLTGLINAFAASTFGENIGVDQLLVLAKSMQGLDSKKVKFRTVPTTGISNNRGNEVLRDEKARAVFNALVNNTPLPSEKPPAESQSGSQQAVERLRPPRAD